MKNLFVLLIGVLILLSCGKIKELTEKKTEKPTEKTTEKTTTSGNTAKDSINTKKDPPPKTTEYAPGTISGLVYGVKDISKSIKYDGKVVASAKWSDKSGDNIIIITETDIKSIESKNVDIDPEQSKRLYGYHYILQNNSNKQLWKIQDFVDKCPADVDCDFIPGSLSITDINKDGIAESTFLYKLGCRSDVSPIGLKLMMHENDTKYALRGETLVKVPEPYGGDIKNTDPSFKKAPDGFLDYAKKQWEKFKEEKFED